MFKKLLIANRGEIACRIIKTARKLNIKTIAVYSDIDRRALHVKLADEAYCIGPAPSSHSYLNREKIIDVARHAKADAIHPGYGFLAEDPEFATLCANNGIIFIGPSASAINAMGDKSAAKILMQKANVPVVPGYQGAKQDLETITQEAQKIGLPVLLKAAAGGGGKGMRLVKEISELEHALQSAKHEAKSSFNNDTIFIEKYIQPARHVEVQIFMDAAGNGVYLCDRDCSTQRRHQKIIEEAKAPNLSTKVRKKMGETAVQAAKAINYLGAGTIEFLVDAKENYYFMEMNTRLQVEHPVTEMITGLDLVAWQLQLACDEPLPLSQAQVHANGHAFEARICAENPANNFAPSTGTLDYFIFPENTEHVRIDTGVRAGDLISPYYDPMIAKLIVWGNDRKHALSLLSESLEKIAIVGVHTNVSFLHQVANNKDFQKEKISTNFIETHEAELLAAISMPPKEIMVLTALTELYSQQEKGRTFANRSGDAFSPWFIRDNWRLMQKTPFSLSFWFNETVLTARASTTESGYLIHLGDDDIAASAVWENEHTIVAIINKKNYRAIALKHEDEIHLFQHGQHFMLHTSNPTHVGHEDGAADNRFISPMPGTIVEVLVKPGQKVAPGERLIVLEAMKMEHTITAPTAGIVKTVSYKAGDLIHEGVELLEFEAESS